MLFELNEGMKSLLLFFHLSLLAIFSNGETKTTTGAQKLSLGQLSTLDLESARFDGDLLFDIEWPGIEAKEQALQSIAGSRTGGDQSADGGDDSKVLPRSFLEESYSASETITMTTIDQEQYTCVLPDLTGEATPRDTDESSEVASPRSLLKSLRGLCTKLLMGYWTYEICHSKFVRQYHEEQVEKGKFKIDEYFLGKAKLSDPARGDPEKDKDIDDDDTADNDPSERPPTFYFTGKSYSYYEVEMDGGTVCDISNEPRSIKIKYICDMDSHKSGTFLHIAELTTCKYEAVVSTRQLCTNKYFRLKENPRHTINCYPEGEAPRRPTVLLEHELSLNQFYPKSSKGTKQGPYGNDFDFDPQESFEKQIARGLPPDEQFLVSFLSGESCLRGGSGWWVHEICYGKYVRQVHEDSNGHVEVYLGYWSESDHKTWFERTGRRRQSKLQVTHLYTNGEVCDVTGAPRSCQVKFKCVKTTKASQVTIFLEEPTTCSYTLTVEASFLCPLLKKTNEIGMIILPQSDTLTFPADSEPPPTSSNTKSSPQSDNTWSSSAGGTNQGAGFHSDRSQSSAQQSKDSGYPDSTHKNRGTQSTTAPSQDQPGKVHESPAMKQQGQSLNIAQGGMSQSQAQPQKTRELEDRLPSTEQRHSPNEPGDTKPQSQVPPRDREAHKPREESVMDRQRDQLPGDTASQATVPQNQAQATGRVREPPPVTKQGQPPEDSRPDKFKEFEAPTQTKDESKGLGVVREAGRQRSDAGDGMESDKLSTGSGSSDRKKDSTSQG